jgi:twitching motility protein PilT
MSIQQLLQLAVERGASDLHLRAGAPPILRIDGALVRLDQGAPRLIPADIRQALSELTTESLEQRFAAAKELDFPYSLEGVGRFRVNASIQRGTVALAFRRIGLTIPTFEQLNLPAICGSLALKQRGLVLVTGPAGSGKSTTLAAMIEHLNQQEARVVVTIEDPIEYLYQDRRSVITQREVGADTHSFAAALRGALRQDVDVILVGEMRDPETMSACLTAAETGHLVLSTLHTKSASLSIDRIVDVFPPHQQPQIRMQLSLNLEGALAQTLLPRLDQPGRIPAVEVMLANPAVRSLIREGKSHQLPNAIQTAAAEGMRTMEQALAELVRQGIVAVEEAWGAANNPEALRSLLG